MNETRTVAYDVPLDMPDVLICVGCHVENIAPTTAVLTLRGDEHNARALVREHLLKHAKFHGTRTALALGLPDGTPIQEDIAEQVAEHYMDTSIDIHTTDIKAERWGRNFIENVGRGVPQATHMPERLLAGAPVFICGAGPSLKQAIPHLAAMRERGYIFASSNAAMALADGGVMPDAIFCAETEDVSAGYKRLAEHPLAREHKRLHVLAMVGSAANWDVPADAYLGTISHEPCAALYAMDLNAYPMGYTGSVTCMAAACAVAWGSPTLVMIGQDFGYPEGRMYADGTLYEDMQVIKRDNGVLEYHGKSKAKGDFPGMRVKAWGGEHYITTEVMMMKFSEWFGRLAAERTVINASVGGARVDNTIELPMDAVVRSLPTLPKRHDLAAIAAALPRPVGRCHNVLMSLIGEARHHRKINRMFPLPGFPLANMWCAVGILRAKRETHDPQQRVAIYRETMARACDEIEALALQAEQKLLGKS